MKHPFHLLLERRAAGLAQRLLPHLPPSGRVLDIGSGTGHNAQALRQRTTLLFFEADVTDMSACGAGPVLFADAQLPFAAAVFDCVLLIFVLQYPADPAPLLLEARRVAAGRVIVLHSTYSGWVGQYALRGNEFIWGPAAFGIARLAQFVGRARFSLQARHFFSRADLKCLFGRCGFTLRAFEPQPLPPIGLIGGWPGEGVSHDLFVLENADA